MSETKKATPVETVPDTAAEVLAYGKGFWDKASKPIIYVGSAVILLAGGYFGYKKLYAEPQEAKAADAIWHAQQYFDQDSVSLALKGDGQYLGFEKVASTYGSTKNGNVAKYCAGICELKLKNFPKAISYLEDFSTDAKQVQAVAYARLADAYSETGKNDKAADLYAKAGHYFPEDDATSAENLFRAGQLSEVLKKNEDAIKYYKEIKDNYPNTQAGRQIDKYLAKLGVVE